MSKASAISPVKLTSEKEASSGKGSKGACKDSLLGEETGCVALAGPHISIG